MTPVQKVKVKVSVESMFHTAGRGTAVPFLYLITRTLNYFIEGESEEVKGPDF